MKLNLINFILIVVVFTIIASSLMVSCADFKPYSTDSIFRKEYPYEGFSNYNYSNTDNSANTDSGINKFLMDSSPAECTKVYGFNGLFCKPYTADKNIDVFSSVKSDVSCVGKSSGLSNSMGGLCLDDNTSNLLKTRGGNQTGADMQIGPR
jgi:hypothetical protein